MGCLCTKYDDIDECVSVIDDDKNKDSESEEYNSLIETLLLPNGNTLIIEEIF